MYSICWQLYRRSLDQLICTQYNMVRGLLGRLFAGSGKTVQGAEQGRFSLVSPGRVAPRLDPDTIPASVTPPPYYRTGRPAPAPSQPDIKVTEQITECESHVNLCCSPRRRWTACGRPGGWPGGCWRPPAGRLDPVPPHSVLTG